MSGEAALSFFAFSRECSHPVLHGCKDRGARTGGVSSVEREAACTRTPFLLSLSRGRRRRAEIDQPTDRPASRTDGQAKIGDHEERSPREYRYFLGGPRDQTCNLYIAPYLPIPVARTPRKYTTFFTTREKEKNTRGGRAETKKRARARVLRGGRARGKPRSLASFLHRRPFRSLSQPCASRLSFSLIPSSLYNREEKNRSPRRRSSRNNRVRQLRSR